MRLIDADKLEAHEQITSLGNGMYESTFVVYMDDIYAQPTIDAVPVRHGKFIGTEYDGYADGNPVYYEWKCSVCGCIFEDEEPTYRYCPHCGTRMDEDEKEIL